MSIPSEDKTKIIERIKSAVLENGAPDTMSKSPVYVFGNKSLEKAVLNEKFREWENTSDASENFWQWIQNKYPDFQRNQALTYLNSTFEKIAPGQVLNPSMQENESNNKQLATLLERFFTGLKDNPLFNWLSSDSLRVLAEHGQHIAHAAMALPLPDDLLSAQLKIKKDLLLQKEDTTDTQNEQENNETPKL